MSKQEHPQEELNEASAPDGVTPSKGIGNTTDGCDIARRWLDAFCAWIENPDSDEMSHALTEEWAKANFPLVDCVQEPKEMLGAGVGLVISATGPFTMIRSVAAGEEQAIAELIRRDAPDAVVLHRRAATALLVVVAAIEAGSTLIVVGGSEVAR